MEKKTKKNYIKIHCVTKVDYSRTVYFFWNYAQTNTVNELFIFLSKEEYI
jgi:hypothetical protein